MTLIRRHPLPLLAAALLCAGLFVYFAAPRFLNALSPASTPRTSHVTPDTWKQAGARLEPYLVQARFAKVPDRLALLVFKDRKQLEVWGSDQPGPLAAMGTDGVRRVSDPYWRFIRSYPVLAASGIAGPKLRDNDRQVPEGVYSLALLNPRSSYYLAMKLHFPNAFDLQKAREDGRSNLNGVVCLHGWEVNSGSLAVGNVAIEELYLLASKVGAENVKVILAPNDLRTERPLTQGGPAVTWLPELYQQLARELQPFRHPTLNIQAAR